MNQNLDLNGNLDFEHSLFSEIIGFYQILNAYTDISVSMYLVWLTMIDWPFFHISTLTFYSLLYCLSFGLATFFSLRYGESIVRFFLDKLIQRQHPSGKVSKWPNTAKLRKAKLIRLIPDVHWSANIVLLLCL